MPDLPSGTVTFLFTDVEGSTRLLHELGAEGYADALAEHRRVIREACAAEGGVEVDTQGDAFFVAFPTAPGALAAVQAMLAGLEPGPIRIRMGVHTGTPFLAAEGYVGPDVNRAARIAAAGHGGQVLVSSSTAALIPSDTLSRGLKDLGEHRLKDLSAPERIYQLGDGDFQPLKSLYRTNLPVPATPFLGREQELAEVVELLSADARLLTLTGPGGTGKTRLALQAAGLASDAYPDGVWWVPLAPLRDPALVLETAAQVVGSKNGLAEHIADKQMLCLFDNFEQVVEAGTELVDLLAACPKLAVLVTSRERLRVRGEQAYPVPPLDESDATALFLARARAVDPGFSPSPAIDELCARLDELPLAIELAAARTAVFSADQLLKRLSQRLDLLKGERDADPRQQTLRATIEWSHDLLTEEEQTLFARLSVFAGGCTYEAAEQVAGADPDTLQSLLDKSLLRKRETELAPRYWMLETIREYASERLEESGEADDLRRRHAESFLALAEEIEPHLRGDPKEWLDRLELEHDNVRAALDHFQANDERQLTLRLAAAVWRFWSLRGHNSEGRRRLDDALARPSEPSIARGAALNAATSFAVSVGDHVAAKRRAEEAIEIHGLIDDAWGAANSVFMQGVVAADEPNWTEARRFFEDSLRRFEELGDDHYVLLATRVLAWTLYELGDRPRARALHESNLDRARASGNVRLVTDITSALASYDLDNRDVRAAAARLPEALTAHLEIGDREELVVDLTRVARANALAGDLATTARLLGHVDHLLEQLMVTTPTWIVYEYDEAESVARDGLDPASWESLRATGRAMSPDEAVALALESLAKIQ